MSAFFSFLGSLTALDWTFIGIAWLLVAFALGTFTGLGIALSGKRAPEPTDVDATWVDVWPVSENTDELRLRFDQIVSAEEWAS